MPLGFVGKSDASMSGLCNAAVQRFCIKRPLCYCLAMPLYATELRLCRYVEFRFVRVVVLPLRRASVLYYYAAELCLVRLWRAAGLG